MDNNIFTNFDKFYNSLTDWIYSVIDVEFSVDALTPVNLLKNEKFEYRYEPVYLKSIYGKEIKHIEGIFKHSNGYYIYLSRYKDDLEVTNFKVKIIYKIEKYEEIKLYINSLKKLK